MTTSFIYSTLLFITIIISAISCTSNRANISLFIDESTVETAENLRKFQTFKQQHPVLNTAKRYRFVKINPTLFTNNGLSPGDQIFISLFTESGVWFTIEKVNRDINNTLLIRGIIAEKTGGYMILSVYCNMVEGVIHTPENNQEYVVSFIKKVGRHILMEIDPEKKDVLPEGSSPMPITPLKKPDP